MCYNNRDSSTLSSLAANASTPFGALPFGSAGKDGIGFRIRLRVPLGSVVQVDPVPPCQYGPSSSAPRKKGACAILRTSLRTLGAQDDCLKALSVVVRGGWAWTGGGGGRRRAKMGGMVRRA